LALPGDRTRDLSIPSRTLYHYSTPTPELLTVLTVEDGQAELT